MHFIRILVMGILLVCPRLARAHCDANTPACLSRISATEPSVHTARPNDANTPAGSSIDASGASGDGVTDDSALINAFLTTFKNGGRVWLPTGKQYLIGSANLLVPPNVTLEGLSSPQSPAGAISLSKASGIILNPAYTITLASGAQLRDLFIRRSGLIANPSAAQVIAAVAQWGKERSVAVTIPPNIGGIMLSDLFIEGFNTCAKASAGQFTIESLSGDCYNGIEVMHAGDNHYIDNVRFEPYYALATPATSGSWARPGIAFYLHDGNTGTVLTRAFSFMYASAILLDHVGVTQIANSGFEWQPGFGNGVTGTKGIRWINHNAGTSVIGTSSLGFDTPLSDEGVGEVIMTGLQAPASRTNTTFNLGGQPAVPATVTIGGRVSVSDLVSLSVTSPSLPGSPLTLRYETMEGDTVSTTAAALARAVNSNQVLITAGIFAGVSSSVVTIDWPATQSVGIGVTTTGDVTGSLGRGRRPAGSSGAIIGANTIGADGIHPIYTVGPHVFSWHIDTPLTGDNILPANWISVDPTSIDRVAFTGVRWSAHPALVDCGGNGHSLNETATDTSGTIAEGIGASECTLKFHTAWPWAPTCLVTSPTGSVLSGYRVTATELTIVNPASPRNRYTYHCSP